MIKLSVPDMHCAKCADRIDKAVKKAGVSATVSLEEKAVLVDGCENCAKKAADAIKEAGYSPEMA